MILLASFGRLARRTALAGLAALGLSAMAAPALAQPAMWVVKDADSTIYFLGTVHLLKPETVWQTDKLTAAIAEAQELWLENGRWLSARSGVLVVKILDVKERRGMRQLICDGGRTMNALVSVWEQHELLPLARRRGPNMLTAVHGPTCMAFDQLARKPLPASLRPGDHLLWFDAGAYHLPWETRFSHGLAEVWWHEGEKLVRVRPAESFASFAGQLQV